MLETSECVRWAQAGWYKGSIGEQGFPRGEGVTTEEGPKRPSRVRITKQQFLAHDSGRTAPVPPAAPAAIPETAEAPPPTPTPAIPETAEVPPPTPTPTPAIPETAEVPPPTATPTPAIPETAEVPPPAPASSIPMTPPAPVEGVGFAIAPSGIRSMTLERPPPPRRANTTKKFLAAMSSMLGTTPPDATEPAAPHQSSPSLLEADPLTPERFKTKTRKALGERLGRPSRRMTLADRTPAILVRDLDATYDERQVLFDLNFSVHRGEILAILGGSGSGKTTLLKHLIGLLRPSRGRIEIAGQDISRLEGDELALVLKSIGMLFQYSALFNSMTIAQNVGLPLREYTDLPEPAIDAIVRLKLALVGLPGIGELLPSELSGGMKKRAALARALALDPDVLFFDEPASGLDPIAAAALDQLILHLNKSFGTTMVIVTHDLDNAFNVAHRILMLDQGKIRKIGTPSEVKASKDPWVASFLARSTALRDAVDETLLAKLGIGPKEKTQRRENPS